MLELTVGGQTRQMDEDDLGEALELYWNAKQGGDTGAALVKVKVDNPEDLGELPKREPVLSAVPDVPDEDDVPFPDALPESDPALPVPATNVPVMLVPVPAPSDAVPSQADDEPVQGGRLSLVAKERIERQEQVLSKNGFALPPPVFAAGTRVFPLGDENFRLERKALALLPTFTDAACALTLQVGDECREDVAVALKDLALSDGGELRVGDSRFLLEEEAFGQLCYLSGFGCGARYLSQLCPLSLRSVNVNAQLAERRSRNIVLRTRASRDGRRSVFAAVSPSYAALDGPDVLATIQPALFDARAEVVYDGKTTTATALWMPDRVVDLAAGDVFKTGVRITCEDTGRGRIRISAVAWRNLCLNLIVIAEGEAGVASFVHRGAPEALALKLPPLVEAARAKVADFLDDWGYARTLKLDVEKTLKTWVEEKDVSVPSVPAKSLLEALVESWHKEPGGTLADALCAVTRAAHETPAWDASAALALERQAGALLVARR